jgi:hypothetical protein
MQCRLLEECEGFSRRSALRISLTCFCTRLHSLSLALVEGLGFVQRSPSSGREEIRGLAGSEEGGHEFE